VEYHSTQIDEDRIFIFIEDKTDLETKEETKENNAIIQSNAKQFGYLEFSVSNEQISTSGKIDHDCSWLAQPLAITGDDPKLYVPCGTFYEGKNVKGK
jgi:hypothetical protein